MREPHLAGRGVTATMSGMNRASIVARDKWSRIIAAQRSSGMSVARFCAARGIPASSLFAWKRRLAGAVGAPPGFVEASVRGAEGVGVAVELTGGRRIIVGGGFDRRLLLDVIEALESGGREAADGARS
jgi:hypothetical protein